MTRQSSLITDRIIKYPGINYTKQKCFIFSFHQTRGGVRGRIKVDEVLSVVPQVEGGAQKSESNNSRSKKLQKGQPLQMLVMI